MLTHKIHKCRFLDWKPVPVCDLAFHSSGKLIAVGRESGDVEILQLGKGANVWCKRVLPGGVPSTLTSIVWDSRSSYRLFSAGLNGRICVWDSRRLRPVFVSDVIGGGIWSLSFEPKEGVLAAACDDGSVSLLVLDSNEQLSQRKRYAPLVGHAICVSFSPSGERLVVGTSEGKLVILHLKNGNDTPLVLNVDSPNNSRSSRHRRSRRALVWSLKWIDDDTIVSGDSHGAVCFWSLRSGTVIERFDAFHADVLCLAVNRANRVVYASGVESKIAVFAAQNGSVSEWVVVGTRRMHSHDVRSLAFWAPESGNGSLSRSLLVSGGLDSTVCISKAEPEQVLKKNIITVFPFVFLSSRSFGVARSQENRLLLSLTSSRVSMWSINDSNIRFVVGISPLEQSYWISAGISDDAKWIAASDSQSVRLYRISDDFERLVNVCPVKELPPSPTPLS